MGQLLQAFTFSSTDHKNSATEIHCTCEQTEHTCTCEVEFVCFKFPSVLCIVFLQVAVFSTICNTCTCTLPQCYGAGVVYINLWFVYSTVVLINYVFPPYHE